ncbi:MAG: hypothetical protein KDA80_02115 [Planctomycetaceae bacterium]|nr:hypothetical protein [Planctomycetaceae bacterium]
MRRSFFPVMLLLILTGATTAPRLEAQQPPPPPIAETIGDGGETASVGGTTVSTKSNSADTPDQIEAESTPLVEISPTGERIIYVPFKDLSGTLNDPQAEVVLPYKEYRKLLDLWREQQRENRAVEALITSASYTATVEGDMARVTVQLAVKVVGESWSELPITLGGAVGKLTANENVLLKGTGNNQYSLLFIEPGQYDVELELAVRVTQSPDGREFSFVCPPVAVTSLDVTVPKQDQDIEIVPNVVTVPVDAMDADVTQIKANVGATNQITVKWHPQASLQPEMNLLASVNNQTLVTVEDGLVHTDTWLVYDILRGEMEQVRAVLPQGHRILDVSSDGRIRSWKTAEDGDNQIVTIDLLSPAKEKLTVELHTEYKLDGNEFFAAGHQDEGAANGIHALDVVRESGQIAVRHSPDLTMSVVEQQGVVRIEAAEVVQRLQGNNAYTFKFYSPNLTLRLSAKPVEPRVIVSHQAQFVFEEDELKFTNTLNYNVERAGVFELLLNVPDGVVIDTVDCGQMREYNVAGEPRVLTVTLNERTLGQIGLRINGHVDLGDGTESNLTLPLIEPQSVERETGSIFVYAKESMEVITDTDNLQGAQPLPANQQSRVGEAVLTSAWSFTRRPVTIPVRTVRKPTRLSANVATTIDVQPELTHVSTQLDYLIEYSGIDTFRVQVPESVSESVRIELEPGDSASAPIKQKTAGDPADGYVVWTILTQREVTGRQRFIVSYDLTTEADEEADASEERSIDVEAVRPLGLVNDDGDTTTPITRIKGEVAVKKDRTLSITANADGDDVERIDIRELSLIPPDGTLAYRYFRGDAAEPVKVTITSRTFEIQDVVSTVVSRALVEIVTGEDAEATYRCRFQIKTSERQRLLVYLPVNLEVLGAFLNDREIKLEKAEVENSGEIGENWTPFWVNVARPESSEEPFLLTFQFLWTVNPTLGQSQFSRGEMVLPLPILGDGETSVVQELKVAIWVPEEYQLVGDPPNFELAVRRNAWSHLFGSPHSSATNHLESWVAENLKVPSGFAQFPTEGRVPYVYTNLGGVNEIQVNWWKTVPMTVFFSIAVVVVGLILLGTSWENKLGILLLAGFVAALVGLRDSHLLHASLQAASFGILVTLALWLMRTLFAMFKPATDQTPPEEPRKYNPKPVDYAVIPPPGVFDHLKPKPKEG